ncbi:hypothetical protein [Ochrobactrum sp. EDr1-4]
MTNIKSKTLILTYADDIKDARIMIFVNPADCDREFVRLKRKHEGDGG